VQRPSEPLQAMDVLLDVEGLHLEVHRCVREGRAAAIPQILQEAEGFLVFERLVSGSPGLSCSNDVRLASTARSAGGGL